MKKGPVNVYKWNRSVVICDRYTIAVNQVMVRNALHFNFKSTIGSAGFRQREALFDSFVSPP
jgi:hypothetical protein